MTFRFYRTCNATQSERDSGKVTATGRRQQRREKKTERREKDRRRTPNASYKYAKCRGYKGYASNVARVETSHEENEHSAMVQGNRKGRK